MTMCSLSFLSSLFRLERVSSTSFVSFTNQSTRVCVDSQGCDLCFFVSFGIEKWTALMVMFLITTTPATEVWTVCWWNWFILLDLRVVWRIVTWILLSLILRRLVSSASSSSTSSASTTTAGGCMNVSGRDRSLIARVTWIMKPLHCCFLVHCILQDLLEIWGLMAWN